MTLTFIPFFKKIFDNHLFLKIVLLASIVWQRGIYNFYICTSYFIYFCGVVGVQWCQLLRHACEKSEDNLGDHVLSFHDVGSCDQTEVLRLDRQQVPFLRSHFASLTFRNEVYKYFSVTTSQAKEEQLHYFSELWSHPLLFSKI